ncbi:MAG: hypothetical protein WBI26_05585 [Syntrophomonadaceae bacterium]
MTKPKYHSGKTANRSTLYKPPLEGQMTDKVFSQTSDFHRSKRTFFCCCART